MQKKNWYKIISIISAIALLLSSMSAILIISATDAALPDVTALIEENLEISNDTDQDDLDAVFTEYVDPALAESGYHYSEITDFYKIKSMPEVVEVGSTYPGAVDGLVLVPGETGYISAYYNYTDGSENVYSSSVLLRIAPERVEKAYTSVSNSITDWAETSEGSETWYYNGGAVDKLIIPDEITALQSGYWPNLWHRDANIKCLVVGTGVSRLPITTGLKAEVVSFKGNNVTIIVSAFLNAKNLKYIHLPESLTRIGAESFRGATKLEYLYLPQSLTQIDNDIFYKPSGDNSDGVLNPAKAHSLTEVTIPAGVTNLGESSFTGAKNTCTITALSRGSSISYDAFYKPSLDPSVAANIYLRAFSGSVIHIYCNVVDAAHKETLNTTMGLAEIRARAQQEADKNSTGIYDSAEAIAADAVGILTAVRNSYNVSSYTAAWQNPSWTGDNGFLFNNKIVITVGGDTVEVPFAVKKSGEFNLQALVDEQDISVNNYTTKDTLADELADIGLDSYDIEVIDFYRINAFNGAVDVSNGGNEILVPGEDGYITAIVRITGANGISIVSSLKLVITAHMEEYTFSTVSNSMSHWTETSSGIYKYDGPSVQKIIIPDEITALKGGAYNTFWAYGTNAMYAKCIVYGTGITTIPLQQYMNNLEVVSFKEGGNITSTAGQAFMGATKLKYIKLPDTITTIGDDLFRNDTLIDQLYLPANLQYIRGKIFNSATNFLNPALASRFAGQYVNQIFVPESVKTLQDGALLTAASECEIIFTSRNTFTGGEYGTNTNHFYGTVDGNTYGANTVLRVYSGSPAASYFTVAEGNLKYIDDMTVCEAAARTIKAATQLTDVVLSNVERTETIIENAYFNVSGISKEWELDEWDEDASTTSNTLILSDGVNSFSVDITMRAPVGFYADGAAILDSDAWTTNGYKQGLRFYNSFKSSAVDKVKIEDVEYTVKDFGIIIKHIANDSATAEAATIDDASFVVGAEGVICESGADDSITRDNEKNKNQFSVYVKNIPQGGRNYYFQTRGYITYTNAGVDVTVYTDSQVTSAKAEFDLVSSNDDYSGMSDWFSGVVS